MSIFVLANLNMDGNNIEKKYTFKGATGLNHWPMEDGAFLGPAGAWNIMWRLGFHPCLVKAHNLPVPSKRDILFVCPSWDLYQENIEIIINWLQKDGIVVSAGNPGTWLKKFLPLGLDYTTKRFSNPYAGMAYLLSGRSPELVSPPQWTYLSIQSNLEAFLQFTGKIVAVHGEHQTPSRALITPIDDAPAILKNGNFFYFNGNPFASFQAWLQGQEDLEPWLSWRHRLFWLDELASYWGKIFVDCGLLSKDIPRPGLSFLPETTVIIRHDLDSSQDTSYLKEEIEQSLAGVYAVLKDRNTDFWINTLKKYPKHEIAFHYNTIADSIIKEGMRRILKKPVKSYCPSFNEIKGKGLLHQVKWAKKQGIGIETLHRHGSFIIYPEWIDAFEEILRHYKVVLGSSTFFRGQVLRWGVDRVDGIRGNLAHFPDPQFPFWLPFKLANAAKCGQLLDCWETSSIMEIEPKLFEQMLENKTEGWPMQKVITLNYHPAHANRSTFIKGGSLNWFKQILKIIKERKIEVITLRDLYSRINKTLEIGSYEKH